MIRVGMAVQSFDPVIGGAQRQIEALAPLLAERGVEVGCVTRGVPGRRVPGRELRPGLELRRVRVPRSASAASIVYTAAGAVRLARWRPDVIHVHELLSPASAGMVASLPGAVPVVAKVLCAGRRGDISRLLAKPAGRRRLRAFVRRFRAFVSLSEESDAELIAAGVPADRIWRIPNGVDANRYRPPGESERRRLRRALGIEGEEPVAVYCGRFADGKRLPLLLEAFAGLPGRLLLFGDGEQEARLRAIARAPGLRGRVRLCGRAADPADAYRAADLYVTASDSEGMSGSVLEAMASGIPVVASPASGMRELVGPATGAVAPDLSAPALRDALRRLLTDPERRRRSGVAARALVRSEYSIDVTADRLVRLYAAMRVNGRAGSAPRPAAALRPHGGVR